MRKKTKLMYIAVCCFSLFILSTFFNVHFFEICTELDVKAVSAATVADETEYWQPMIDNYNAASVSSLVGLVCFAFGCLATVMFLLESGSVKRVKSGKEESE